MTIIQEESNLIEEAFLSLGLPNAFNLIESISSDFSVDTEVLNVYCDETVSLLSQFQKKVSEIEKNYKKKDAKQRFFEQIHRNDNE